MAAAAPPKSHRKPGKGGARCGQGASLGAAAQVGGPRARSQAPAGPGPVSAGPRVLAESVRAWGLRERHGDAGTQGCRPPGQLGGTPLSRLKPQIQGTETPQGQRIEACPTGPALPSPLLSARPPQGPPGSQARGPRPRAASPELLLGAVEQGSAPETGWREVPQPRVPPGAQRRTPGSQTSFQCLPLPSSSSRPEGQGRFLPLPQSRFHGGGAWGPGMAGSRAGGAGEPGTGMALRGGPAQPSSARQPAAASSPPTLTPRGPADPGCGP